MIGEIILAVAAAGCAIACMWLPAGFPLTWIEERTES